MDEGQFLGIFPCFVLLQLEKQCYNAHVLLRAAWRAASGLVRGSASSRGWIGFVVRGRGSGRGSGGSGGSGRGRERGRGSARGSARGSDRGRIFCRLVHH